jgi:glutamine amidotransferase
MKKKVTIIDIGSGNILSIKRAFEKWNAEVEITYQKEKILSASRLVLPGVGAFKNAIDKLNSKNFCELIPEIKLKEIPLLGICLGMQLFFDESEEFGKFKGLSLIKGKVKKLPISSLNRERLKIPSIGWHKLILEEKAFSFKAGKFFKNFNTQDQFYFVHSYCARPKEKDVILASYNFGGHLIPSIVAENNIIGCQFHPEKSGPFGLNLINNFISL